MTNKDTPNAVIVLKFGLNDKGVIGYYRHIYLYTPKRNMRLLELVRDLKPTELLWFGGHLGGTRGVQRLVAEEYSNCLSCLKRKRYKALAIYHRDDFIADEILQKINKEQLWLRALC